jgi:hypothetical protein
MANLQEQNPRDRETPNETLQANNQVSDRPYKVASSSERSNNNGILIFLLGVLTTTLLAVVAGGLYFFVLRPQPATPPTAQPAIDPAGTNPAQSNAPTAPEPSPASPQTTQPAGDLPTPQTLNLQINHANGSTMRLTELSFNEDSIVATLSITNGYKEPIKLNASEDMVISDSLGNSYSLAAPPDNSEITIQPGTTVKGQFVFRGRFAPTANTVTLTTNSKFGGDAIFSRNPKMVFANIPVRR